MREKLHPHHFDFSHNALPQVAFRDAEMLRENLQLNAQEVVSGLWGYVGELLKQNDIETLEGEGPKVQRRKTLSGLDAWVVTMPEPEAQTESFFVGLVATKEDGFSVFVLDKAEESNLLFRTLNEDGTSEDMGFAADPNVNVFMSAVQEKLTLPSDS